MPGVDVIRHPTFWKKVQWDEGEHRGCTALEEKDLEVVRDVADGSAGVACIIDYLRERGATMAVFENADARSIKFEYRITRLFKDGRWKYGGAGGEVQNGIRLRRCHGRPAVSFFRWK